MDKVKYQTIDARLRSIFNRYAAVARRMNLLLDTHVLLWALAKPERLRPKARAAIVEPRHAVYVNAATAWELAIKRALR